MSADALFDGFDEPVVAEDLTPGERRRRRQQSAIDNGHHPLSTVLGYMPLLDDADATCGKCVHRILRGGAAKHYPKCDIPGRATRGEATDIRAWWPGCTSFEAKP